jgi:ferredoxin
LDLNLPRTNLYQALAEALAEPPGWLELPGREWPLFEAALELAPESEAARNAVVAMMEIDEENLERRQGRYAALFASPNRPLVWIYKSGALSGRLFSEISLEVEQWYRAAGVEIVGAELPDHASLELAFLAHLAAAEQSEFARFENDFLQKHALRWLPDLGRALVSSGDMVYGPIGCLLSDWLEEINPNRQKLLAPENHRPPRAVPAIHMDLVEDCTLCGFCAQVCPTRALVVRENHEMTGLKMSPRMCVGCGKCVKVCDPRVLKMDKLAAGQDLGPGWITLRNSPRGTCRACGKPLISQAELAYVAARLGDPAWLEYCQECHPGFF